MNLSPVEMCRELQSRIPDIADPNRIVLWLEAEQDYIGNLRADWSWMHDIGNTISATHADAIYDLPSDYDHMIAMWNQTDDRAMYPKTLEWFREYDPDAATEGSPSWYIVLGPTGTSNIHEVRLVDMPDAAYTIGFDYYKRLPDLSLVEDAVGSLIPDHELLMLGAEIRGRIDAEEDDDERIMNRLQGLYDRRLMALINRENFKQDKDLKIRVDRRITAEGFADLR